ncbi:MAG: hypothetical protein FWE31_02305 [Firmicutes bacterium]|nr:hypothetical protein [Bacillota bacterium]
MVKFIFAVCLGLVVLLMPLLLVGCNRTPTYQQTQCGDFLLTISVGRTRIWRGRNFEIDIVFENLSGKRHEVYHGFSLVNIFFNDGAAIFPSIRNSVIEIDEVRRYTVQRGNDLRRGRFELMAIASFGYENDHQTWNRIISNTIFVRVR